MRQRREALEGGRERRAQPVGQLALGLGLTEQLRVEHPQRAGRVLEAEPVAVERIVGREQVLRVEAGEEGAGARGVGREPAVQPAEEQRAQLGRRVARPEAPHLVLAEDVVAGEELVRRLAREHDLEPCFLHRARKTKQRGGRRSQHRLLGQLDSTRERLRDRGGVDHGPVEDDAQLAGDRVLRPALVVALVGEPEPERGQAALADLPRGDRGDRRGVEPAAQVRPHLARRRGGECESNR